MIPRTPARSRVVLTLLAVVVLAGCSGVGGLVPENGDGGPGLQFQNATAASGLDYVADGTGSGNGNSGVYVADADRDGWTDLLAVGGDAPELFANENGTFAPYDGFPEFDRPFKSASWVDYDGDGWQDLLLFPRYGEVVALHNDRGEFEREDVGIGNVTYPLGATAADYDADGDQDLFVYQSGDWAESKPKGYLTPDGFIDEDNGYPNFLYENVGGEFRRVEDAGFSGKHWSLAASFVDLTGDGLPDVHVANDYNNDTLYVNRGDGTFERRTLGSATARNGMSSEVADVNGDGLPDVFVTNIYFPDLKNEMSAERYERLRRFMTFVIHSGRTKGNNLLINQGDGGLEDRAEEWGVRKGGWGWAASLADFDNDGDRDLVHSTQKVVRIDPDDPTYTLPMVWERRGGTFERVNKSVHGMEEADGRGMVTLDHDRDGDRDLVVATRGGPYVLYKNTLGDGGNGLQFRVTDENGSTALGAVVTVGSGEDEQVVRQSANVDYLSQDTRVEHVGLGDRESVTIQVRWPDGTERTFEDVETGQRVQLTKDGVEAVGSFE